MTQIEAPTHAYLQPSLDRKLVLTLAVSLVTHGLIITAVVVKQRFFNDGGPGPSERIMAARLLKLGTPPRKLEQREMPRKVVEPPPARPEATLPGSAPTSPTPKRTTPRKRVDYSKQMAAALDQIKAQVDQETRELPPDLPATPGHPDGVEDGDVTDPRLARLGNTYIARVGREIRSRGGWAVPSVIQRAEARKLSATVLVLLDAGGNLIKRELVQPSGNDLFDNAVLMTV